MKKTIKTQTIQNKTYPLPGWFIVVFISFVLSLSLTLTGCFSNTGQPVSSNSSTLSTDSDTTDDQEEGTDLDLEISNVIIAAGGGSDESYNTTIYFNADDDNEKISTYCDTSGNKPCYCEFSWTEINEETGSSVSVPRIIKTVTETVQGSLVTCAAPAILPTEIDDGVTIKILVKSNLFSYDLDAYSYLKGDTSGSDADFRDQNGQAFLNIHRYTCYEKINKGLVVESKESTATNSITGEIKDYLIGTQFCVAGEGGDGCNTPDEDYSSQSYIYEAYVTSILRGGIVVENERYACGKVEETLVADGSIGAGGGFWPLDSTFALAKGKTETFTVPVVAPSVLQSEFDLTTASTTCESSGDDDGGSLSSSAIATKCLGFGIKPETNGSCPSFTDSDGLIRKTYRLRRYVALYPVTFDGTGDVIEEPRGANVAYVLDREVSGSDPLDNPITYKGPLPCPFAYYDHSGVLELEDHTGSIITNYAGGKPGYVASSSTLWDGKNVDGTHFPNVDDASANSCATTFPIVTDTSIGDTILFATSHESNEGHVILDGGITINLDKVYVRPVKKWSPHYEEDTDFYACAPESDDFVDAPLHFAKNEDGNIAWCAESSPTQTDFVEDLDKKQNATLGDTAPGNFVPFTSHAVKNSSSANCTATVPELPAGYPSSISGDTCSTDAQSQYAWGAGNNVVFEDAASHESDLIIDFNTADGGADNICANNSCDRTVINTTDGSWKKHPLLAPAHEMEEVLRTDKSFVCGITYDSEGNKVGQSPSDGCCSSDVVFLESGVEALTDVKEIIGPDGVSVILTVKDKTAHLEPDVRCTAPSY